jgi:ribose transport system ATP-binding protein
MDSMNKQAEGLLADLGIEMDPSTAVRDLSVAYMQLVEIAKAVSTNVRILVFDEPTAPLTSNEVDALFLLINKLRKKGVTMLYISHRMEEIFEISDTVTVLRDGTLIKKMQTREADRSALIDLMVGRQLIEKYPEKDYSVCDEVLSLSGLSSDKVHDISFSVCRGEILGIAGLVGAGRTELARLIFGADPKRSGTVRVDGVTVDISSPKDAIRCGIALVPEDRKQQGLFLELAVRYNMSLPIIKALAAFLLINRFAEKTKVAEYIKNLQIRTPSDTVQIKNLSGGNQQKAVIAKWLATDSKVLIFDEPTRGIDVGAKQEIYRLMHELASKGLGIIMISSEMPELIGLADRLLVMRNGTIAGELSREETTQNAILQLAAGYTKETV